ncbi:nitrate/nitrite transporter NrtS [Rhodoferax sp. 4810]|nr:nitrate/nitrite transporter NrtS [Rhodoferax jenense]
MNNNRQKITWQTWPEAFQLFLHGTTLHSCIPVALIVGLILSTINQSDVIICGAATVVTWLKVGMNFVVPFCVSSYGFLNGCRSERALLILKNEPHS